MLGNLSAALGRVQEIQQAIDSLQGPADAGAPAPAPSSPSPGQPATFTQALTRAKTTSTTASVTHSDKHFDTLIAQTAVRYGVDPDLVHAVVQAESDYNPKCLSSCGAMGLMQLMPENVKDFGVRDPWDPAQNIEGGVRQLRQQLDRFHDVDLAVAAYNAGGGAVHRYGGVPPYPETQAYVKHVMQYLWQRKGQ